MTVFGDILKEQGDLIVDLTTRDRRQAREIANLARHVERLDRRIDSLGGSRESRFERLVETALHGKLSGGTVWGSEEIAKFAVMTALKTLLVLDQTRRKEDAARKKD